MHIWWSLFLDEEGLRQAGKIGDKVWWGQTGRWGGRMVVVGPKVMGVEIITVGNLEGFVLRARAPKLYHRTRLKSVAFPPNLSRAHGTVFLFPYTGTWYVNTDTAAHCNTLHHTATNGTIPHHTAPHCITLQHAAIRLSIVGN